MRYTSLLILILALMISLHATQGFCANQWSMYKGSPDHRGFNAPENLNPPLQLKWSWTSNSTDQAIAIESSALIYKNKVFIGTIHGPLEPPSIKSFDLTTGNMLWHYFFGVLGSENAAYATPVIYNDKIYVPNWDGYLYCFNVDNHDPVSPADPAVTYIWRTKIVRDGESRGLRSSPVIKDDTIYIATVEGNTTPFTSRIVALDINSGVIKSQYEFADGLTAISSAAIDGNQLVITVMPYYQMGGRIIKFDISNSTSLSNGPVWNYSLGADEWGASSPVIYEGVIYYLTSKQTTNKTVLYLIDLTSGNQITSYEINEYTYWPFTTPSIAYGNIYIPVQTKLVSLNIASLLDQDPLTDPLSWEYQLPLSAHCNSNDPCSNEFQGSSPIVANGLVFIGVGDVTGGKFIAVDAFTGENKFLFEGPAGYEHYGMGYSIATPAVAEGKVVFASAHDFPWSGLYVFESAIANNNPPVFQNAFDDKHSTLRNGENGLEDILGFDNDTIDNVSIDFVYDPAKAVGNWLSLDANHPSGNPTTQRVYYDVNNATKLGNYPLTFRVKDSRGAYYIDEVNVHIKANTAPVIYSINSTSVNEGQASSLLIKAADSDKDPLTFTSQSLPSGAKYLPLGDVSQSDTISSIDASLILSYLVGKSVFTQEQKLLADVTQDGTISSLDASYILQFLAGKRTSFNTYYLLWTPSFSQAGNYTVRLNVSDGALASFKNVNIEVKDVNVNKKKR